MSAQLLPCHNSISGPTTIQLPHCGNTTWQSSHWVKIIVLNTGSPGYLHGQEHISSWFQRVIFIKSYDGGFYWALIPTSPLLSNIYRHNCKLTLSSPLQAPYQKPDLTTLASYPVSDEIWKNHSSFRPGLIYSFILFWERSIPPKAKGERNPWFCSFLIFWRHSMNIFS